VERSLGLLLFQACVLDPEVGIRTRAPIGHPLDVEELSPKIEAAHFAVFVDVADRFDLSFRTVSTTWKLRYGGFSLLSSMKQEYQVTLLDSYGGINGAPTTQEQTSGQ
jgi:hypothetical protein